MFSETLHMLTDYIRTRPTVIFKQARQCRVCLLLVFTFNTLLLLCFVRHIRSNQKLRARIVTNEKSAEKLPLFRDLYAQEAWSEIERDGKTTPNQIPHTVHYVWCGRKQFRFQHYLGLLSAVRLLQPLKVVFHYTHLPETDPLWYHVWFQEFKQSYANLELQFLRSQHPCGSKKLLETALDFLRRRGGVYIGENVIMTRFPHDVIKTNLSWSAFGDVRSDVTRGVVMSKRGLSYQEKEDLLVSTVSSGISICGSLLDLNVLGPHEGPPCIVVSRDLYPRDIWSGQSPFAQLCRWLYYGKRSVLGATPAHDADSDAGVKLVPRVAHFTWLDRENAVHGSLFTLLHYLSVLSALHVAGLERVLVHGELEPHGPWWDRLKREEGGNVTFVLIDAPRGVFQQNVRTATHRSDVIRIHLLHTYGGVYQDRDVLWVKRVPDWLLRYPTVLCPDWPAHGQWPDSFNMGVMLARPGAPFLRHFLSTWRHFLDGSHAFNAILTPYKVYERHPDTLYVDTHLQVICYKGHCHPTWQADYKRNITDSRQPAPFDWREARAFHLTVPKPPPSLTSLRAIVSGKDVYSELGRHVLRMAGRKGLMTSLID